MMEDYPHICIDPLGDRHTIMEKYYVCGVAEDRNRSYQDKYYPIGRYRRASFSGMSEDTEAAIRMIAQNWADRRQATFRWMLVFGTGEIQLSDGSWLDLRARWVRHAAVDSLPVGMVEDARDALIRGLCACCIEEEEAG